MAIRGGRREAGPRATYFRCRLTSLVMSNMLTDVLPPNTCFRLSSALIIRLFFLSWSPFFLMYAQSFLVISVRGIGLAPTTSASLSRGVTGRMKAAFGFRPPLLLAVFFATSLSSWRRSMRRAGAYHDPGVSRDTRHGRSAGRGAAVE